MSTEGTWCPIVYQHWLRTCCYQTIHAHPQPFVASIRSIWITVDVLANENRASKSLGRTQGSLYQQVRKWCTADQIELCGWVWFSIRRINKSVPVGGYLLSMSVALSAEKFHLTWRVIRETHDVSVCHNESRPTEKWCDCRGKLVTGDWQLTAGWGCCQRHLLPRFGTCDCYRVKRFNLVKNSGLREGACV